VKFTAYNYLIFIFTIIIISRLRIFKIRYIPMSEELPPDEKPIITASDNDAYLKRLLNTKLTAASFDIEMAELKKRFADEERRMVRFTFTLLATLLAMAIIAALCLRYYYKDQPPVQKNERYHDAPMPVTY